MKQGRPGIALKKIEIGRLFGILYNSYITYQQMANKIGISRYQLYNPMNKRSRCSEKTYKKIQRFLARN